MRVKKLLFLLVLLTIAGRAAADGFSVESPFSIKAGETKELPIQLAVSAGYASLQFNLNLPSGVTLTTHEEKVDEWSDETTTVYDARIDDNRTNGHDIGCNLMPEGYYIITVTSTANKTIKGASGNFVYVKLHADESISGTLEASVTGIKMVKPNQEELIPDNVNFAISVQGLPKVTAVNKEITYGDAVPTFEISSEDGAEGVPEVSALTLQTAEGTPVTYDATTILGAGTYTIVVPASADNKYVAVNGTLTVKQKVIELDWSNQQNLTYKAQNQRWMPQMKNLSNDERKNVRLQIDNGGKEPKDAGTYTLTIKGVNNNNYTLPTEEDIPYQIVIEPYDISNVGDTKFILTATLSESDKTITYDGNVHTPQPTVEAKFIGNKEGEEFQADVTGLKFMYSAEPKDVGPYQITKIDANGSKNFKGVRSLTDVSFEITKAAGIEVTVAANEGLTYDGSSKALVTPPTEVVGGTLVYALTEVDVTEQPTDENYSETVPTGTESKTYKVWYKVRGDGNHNDTTPKSVEVTIAKAAATVTLADWATTLTYDGTEQSLVEADKFTVTDGCTLTFIKEDNTETTNAADIKGKDAKTYTIKYYVKGNDNYSDSEQKEATRVINPLEAVLKWSNTGLTYNGEAQTPTAEVSNRIDGDDCTVTVSGGQTNAGENYTATAESLSNSNYQLPETKTQTFTIAQYDINVNKDKLAVEDIEKVNYTGNPFTPQPTVTAEGVTGNVTVTYAYKDNTNVGTGKVTITGTGNFTGTVTNEDLGGTKLTFEIDKAAGTAATVAAKTGLVYTGAAQELITATGDVTEGCKMMYKVDDATEYAETLPKATTAGTHTVSWYLDGGENYGSTTAVDVTVEIAKATLTVTADAKTKEYGAGDPEFTLTYGTFLGSDTKDTAIQTEPKAAVTAEHVNVGEYDITVTVTGEESANYTLSPVSGKLTITPKTVGLSWSNTSFTYNNKEQAPTATATGLVGTDECTVTVEGAKKDAGSYTATATALSNSNYQLPTEGKTQAFTIVQADFSNVTLDPATLADVTYNGRDQKPTVAVTFGSEDVFTLDAATEYTVSYKLGDETVTSLTDAGTYTVVIDSKEKNFSAGQKTLTLTIGKADLSAATVSVSDQEYTGSALTPVPTVTINGTVVPASDYDVAYDNNTNIGTATVTVTALANSKNFTANTTATGSFSISEPYVAPTFSTDEGSDIEAYPTSNDEVTVTQLSAAMLNGTEEIPTTLNSSEGGTYKVTEIAAYAFRDMPADVVLTLPEGVKTTSPVKNVINGDGTCKELDLSLVKNFEPAKTLTVEKVTYKREMKSEAITVCMPYEVDVPEDVTAYVLKGDTEGKVTFDLLDGTKVPAYLPCMLRREVPAGARRNGLTAPEAVTIDLSARNVVINPSDGDEVMKRDDFELCGTTTGLTHKEGYDLQAFILQPDMTWKMTASAAVEDADKQYLAPFQAYLCSTRAISGSIDMQLDSTTGIDAVINDNGEMTNDNEGWYDLNGRKLAGKPTTKGIYVKNGRKVVIK